jgi:nitrogen fixation/metabolism regulation signal transduction histidine kinase
MTERRTSIEGRIALLLGSLLAIAVAVAILIDRAIDDAVIAILVSLLLTIPLTLWILHLQIAPLTRLLRAVSDGVACLKDGDFSFSLARDRDDELGDLVQQYNEVVAVLRDERQNIFQRELLLDTVIQSSPLALVLVNPRGHVIYANMSARRLFNDGRRLAGSLFEQSVTQMPAAMAEALRRGNDGLFSIGEDDDRETWHLSVSRFALNGQDHSLYLLKHLTRELNRQEVATWKKVIRVISHELNNSLAPISSLAHSGQLVAEQHDDARLADILGTIEGRAQHLNAFIDGYARFAKLPSPRLEAVDWDGFLHLLEDTVAFRRVGAVPTTPAWMDTAQMEQVLINLVKNAHEAGGPADAIEVELQELSGGVAIKVRDGGQGMSAEVLHSALLPFYSTKQSGTGLGLPLCREIVEAHGGRLSIHSRPEGGVEVIAKIPGRPSAGLGTASG